ncbi:uncharacterized protein BDW43DRAFT_306964 [Aspergillus alliaceus]|uniref:uncharacterized protein n=1 Tax=Petromyces alliaceus TaxID=209559 RepID=UPI0012A433C0|nr:uncharacterized protein BDW43DRAFT_306964 [Aspergillus alliaceus]KAB8238278.1 hypothetical protein BDW43DRAFT_306964 [Aspergillus alliaceus]
MSPLASEDVLAEYGTQAKESICFDGSKRDILVWLGDFVHTARILSVITSRANHAQGTLQFLLDSQIAGGELSISPSIGYNMKLTPDAPAPSDSYYLRDYKLLGSISFHDYMQWSYRLDYWEYQCNHWPNIFQSRDIYRPRRWRSAVACAALQALAGAADVPIVLGDTHSAARYRGSSSLDDPDNFSVSGVAFCISSGVASSDRMAHTLATLSRLRLGPGYEDSSDASASDPTVNILPNANELLL